jgi:hypothetical protein
MKKVAHSTREKNINHLLHEFPDEVALWVSSCESCPWDSVTGQRRQFPLDLLYLVCFLPLVHPQFKPWLSSKSTHISSLGKP